MTSEEDLDSKFICLKCIDDKSLCEIVVKDAKIVSCSYCDHKRKGIKLTEFADIVDEYLRNYLAIGSSYPTFPGDSESAHYEQEGELTFKILTQQFL